MRKTLKYRKKSLANSFENKDAAFINVFNHYSDLEKFWKTKSAFLKKNITNNEITETTSSFFKNNKKNSLELRKAFKAIKQSKSNQVISILGLYDSEAIKNTINHLPENISRVVVKFSKGLVNQDKYAFVKKAVDLWAKTKDEEFVIAELVQFLYYIRKSYQNPREYLDIGSRTFIEDKINEFIDKRCNRTKERHLFLLSADVNGLKTVNDFGVSKSHLDGNRFLLVFTHILQSGRTTLFLKSLGVRISVAAQSGDEFLLLLDSPYNLAPFLKEIEELFLSEMLATEQMVVRRKILKNDGTVTDYIKEYGKIDIANIINFNSPDVITLMQARGATPQKDEKFKMTCSFGWASLTSILDQVDLAKEKGYLEMRNKLKNMLFAISDSNSIDNKLHFKAFLKENGYYVLYVLFTVRADYEDLLELRQKNASLKDQIKLLKSSIGVKG